MRYRRSLLFAVIASLVVLSAGVSVIGTTDAGGELGPVVGAADEETEPYGQYAELLAVAPASFTLQSPSERSSKDQTSERRFHSWRCPICHETKLSLDVSNGDAREAAANNLESHIRNTGGDGHGRLGEVPAEITRDILLDNAETGRWVGE